MFMKLADVALFARSAQSDAQLAGLWATKSPAAVFDRLYRTAPENDPWASASPRFRYQHRKYDTIAELIPGGRFRRALDIGCGTGLFSQKLAQVADAVTGVDVSGVAVTLAQQRTAAFPNLEFRQCDVLELPQSWDGAFDLVTILDTLYYLPPPIHDDLLKRLALRIARLVSPGGLLVLANHYFAGLDADSRLTRRIHDAFRWSPAFRPTKQYQRPFYLVSMLQPQA